ncbi:endonuclease MutS2 [Candidatus Chloroploca sp. M-50]|uniref:Endonuclease MutS2 n=1 Tax=Candidatus Chloroploca mongolica TaxID=2528176 RepID=A0ABS4DFG7_9CHLR|nr:endonuclease MutS2 [Candidatus Chloroploca mongolica]MBP1468182.1 endonuclease MutS2 [Candidatus Chloroploca mongolica]MBP1468562.1 endonuclease MutS2 [Candidatus Chloroploca mongolica]
MNIAPQTLETLEFFKIREHLARYTAFSASRELALALLPSTQMPEVRQALALTSEARQLLDEFPDLSIGGVRDIRRAARHAERGGLLDGPSLLEIAGTTMAARQIRTRLLKLNPELFPLVIERAALLPILPPLEDEILHAIGDDGNVLDSASAELGRLRREIRIAFARLQEKLQHMIGSATVGAALQEPIITVRNGRYVVPVKASHRKDVRGLVHDQSSSGATLYIEPMAVVELNNRWRELQSAEEEEVQRILAALAERVGLAAPLLVAAVEAIAELDLAFAKAKYATSLRCVAPEVVNWSPDVPLPPVADPQLVDPDRERAPLLLTEARHPLLDQSTVVPVTLWLGDSFRLLLITGPNTGGKTVALKTTGLLALMAQAGLHIPAAAPSRLPVFHHIFADIGDEQSIEQSLSTFSSHMRTIIRVLGALEAVPLPEELWDADHWKLLSEERPPALVLFDELGAGTDPVEGAALARAIVERLLELGVLGVATTHYAELKAFAYNTDGVQNASVEFDLETLAPTYRLSIGLPGRSNALAIARRLGLDSVLVDRAHSTLDRSDAAVEDLLAGIHKEREATARALQRAEELRVDAEKYRDRLEHEWLQFQQQREQETEAAHRELEEELREARGELKRLRDDFRSVSLSRQWLEEADQRLKDTAEQVKAAARQARPATVAPRTQEPRPLQPGDTVMVRSVGLKGEIVALDHEDATATVQVGGFRMTVDLRELTREKGQPETANSRRDYRPERTVSLPPPPDVSMTFDMRGWRAHEVSDRLDRYLNDAYLAGLSQVRLVHGKGTGALRQIVRDVLQTHPLVVNFTGGGRDGGDGVTVATLVER